MSTTFILELSLRPEGVDDALKLFGDILGDTRAFDGCEGVEIFQDADDPTTLVLVEKWVSRDHHARYTDWRRERGDMKAIAGHIVGTAKRFLQPTGI